MPQSPFPAPGHDGDEPPLRGDGARDGDSPGDAVRDGTPGQALPGGGDDFDLAAELARFIAEVDAGRIPVPPEDEHAPAVLFSVGEAADVDPVVLAAMAGPDGLGGQAFAQDRAADAMPPGPLLAAGAENAAADLGTLTDGELLGVVSAGRRLASRGEYLELAAIAEYAARGRAAYDASVAAGARPGRRDGEFAGAELGMHLLISARAAGDRMDLASGLAARLPATFAALGAGAIDGGKAHAIWVRTRFLSDEHAAHADAVLAAAAPGLRYDLLARRAARLEMKLDPGGARRRREHARAQGRRVEARREPSGSMAFGARELAVTEALAARAVNDADAAALRRAGVPGSLRAAGAGVPGPAGRP